MDFRTLLKTKEFVVLDGAMGTMLQAKGLEMGGTPEALNIDKPDWLVDIHRQYINAAQTLFTPTLSVQTDTSLKSADILSSRLSLRL